jgi:hypothetical protein
MSWDTVMRGIDAVLQSDAGRPEKAVRLQRQEDAT